MELLNQEFIQLVEENVILVILLLIWSLVWKGIALWKSSRLSHKWWFLVILVANTVGILEIVYIFFIANKYKVETKDSLTAKK